MMINFTVGPVQTSELICNIGAEQIPYFRTPEFSSMMKENEQLMKRPSGAEEAARVVFITGSGTASMEATVMNVFDQKDKVLVINGGSFGQRFAQICKIHKIPYEEIKLEFGENLEKERLYEYSNQGYTGLLVNIHETSTGMYYDINMISEFCKENNLFFVVDAISSFIADPIDMSELGIDVMITGSQKALACPPGISIIVLSEKAVRKVNCSKVESLYFDLKDALKDGERGQTPFTPAVGILRQINARLNQIEQEGLNKERERIATLARDFRTKIQGLPLEIASPRLSNAVTPIHPTNMSAYKIFTILKDEYNIWVCPNGGELADKIFRVGHIGELTLDDNQKLVDALHDILK